MAIDNNSKSQHSQTDDNELGVLNDQMIERLKAMMSANAQFLIIKSQYADYKNIYHQLDSNEFTLLTCIDIPHLENNKTDGKLYFVSQNQLADQAQLLRYYHSHAQVFNIYNDNLINNYYDRQRLIEDVVNIDLNYLIYRYDQQKDIYELIGVCMLYPMLNQLEISCSYSVLPKFHKQGLGTRILQLLESYVMQLNQNRQEPWHYMTLLIDIHNIPSCRLAEKCNFKRINAITYSRNKVSYEYIKNLTDK